MGLFSSYNDRQIAKVTKTAKAVDALSSKYAEMSNEQLTAQTAALKARLSDGATLDSLLPDAFALVREASERVLGMRHFFVQILGGIVLHQGRIAEMGTGEGKTLVATLPAYLNALTGKGVHIVTVNDYLAQRDAAWMGKVFRFLGLTVGVIAPQMSPEAKRAAYNADITYATNNELGFDYLRDNMVTDKAEKVQREMNYAIIDEVDSILIDEARTPLIISGRGGKTTDLYVLANRFVKSLKEEDYDVQEKEKTVALTESGVEKAEKTFKVENLADLSNTELYHHITQALKANVMMHLDRDYIVNEGQVLIVDEFTGRVMVGRRYSDGLHQAIEAKENVKINDENKTLASITFQNFFRMYPKCSGMTGTAKTEETEFEDVYNLDVVTLPTNLPSKRVDKHDVIYTTVKGKMTAIVQDIIDTHATGQPVLVGTVSVEKSEQLSAILKRKGIAHNVLNAKNHRQEAEIIAQSGRKGAVTIATNMAGRGTDIMLGGNADYMAKQKLERDGYAPELIEQATSFIPTTDEAVLKIKAEYKRHHDVFAEECAREKKEVLEVGGLHIIGTERHESRRIDNQLRGRAGRQGDPGSTIFYISLEDDVARIFGGERIKPILDRLITDENTPISSGIITKQIESAQKRIESMHFSSRKNVLTYDDVLNTQRGIIYGERNKVLDGINVHEQILKMMKEVSDQTVAAYADVKEDVENWDLPAFNAALEKKLLPEGSNAVTEKEASWFDLKKLSAYVYEKAVAAYEDKIAQTNAAADEYYANQKEATDKEIAELSAQIEDEENLEPKSVAEIKKRIALLGVRLAQIQKFDFSELERRILLRTVDRQWMDHIDAMETLRRGIGLRGYGQRDPRIAYREEGLDMFEAMIGRIHEDCVTMCAKVSVNFDGGQSIRSGARPAAAKPKTVNRAKGVQGRNDLCACGSGLKYKNCCGKNTK